MALVIISSSCFLVPLVLVYASFLLILLSSQFPRCACGPLNEHAEAATGNETDMQSLLTFKDGITSDPFGALNSWNHSMPFCQWFGVSCGHRHRQRVTKLKLDNLGLKGLIPPHIGNLSFLRVLLLQNNSLGPVIPPQIGNLRRLKVMWLQSNSVVGEITVNISSCSNLVSLDLSGNNLGGIIPPEMGMLSRLEDLRLGRNLRIAGSIPASLGNLSSLRFFYASGNDISGSIPSQLGRLKHLESFEVGYNKLVGIIPRSIWNISSIKAFFVGGNQIRGRLPSELGGNIFPSIAKLLVSYNLFTGTIPVSISNASYLEVLQMESNKLRGDVPPMEKLTRLHNLILQDNYLGTAGKVDDLSFLSSLANATNLETIALTNNSFGGVLPRSIGNLSCNCKILQLGDNKVSGIIPHEVGNLVCLEVLYLAGNKLTGNVPSSIGNLKKLQVLALQDNDMTGIIPPSIGNLSLLLYIYMDGNHLHGVIPSSLGKCKNLLQLLIYSNHLQGNIPPEIFSPSSLHSLDLSGNRMTGNLPKEVGTLINLVELDVSSNMLSGKIPNTLASCVELARLDMGVNNFSGTVPSSFSSLRGLEILNLSRNNFSGTIPKYLELFPFLQLLDLSLNNFEGPVPDRGVLKNTTALNVGGNVKLCGGIPKLCLPNCKSNPLEKKLRVKLTIGLAFGVTGVVLFLFLLFLYLFWSKEPRQLRSLHSPWNSLLKLSYQNLYEATDGFSDSNLIGVGSFGSVYKGQIPQGQQTVAVKVLNLRHHGASRSFQAECEALRRTRHRNLLKVVTACSSIDHQGNDFKALVYEFMHKGSLDDWLHSPESQDETEANGKNLDLSQRLDVVIGVASAVEYLHHRCEDPIVHCDLKPSNILLDDDMVAHVGDFGLAKLIQEGTAIQSSNNQSSTIGIRGSVGYVAPEYGMGNEVSTFGDIYGFGIIVLETFIRKKPTYCHLFNGCLNLRDHVEMALPEQVETVADPKLLLVDDHGDTTRSEKIKECLVSLFRVGIACAQELPRDRMAINDAIIQLHIIKKALLRTGSVHVGGRATLEIGSQVPY